jgi:hypothetical protein
VNWSSGWTPVALYIALMASTACLWPGLILRQTDARTKRLLWRVMAAHACILYFLLFCDLMLLHVAPGHPFLDHARRVGARWSWAVLYTVLLAALWRTLPPCRSVWGRRACTVVLLLALTLSPTAGTTQEPASVYGNIKSRIYHWVDCPNYPRLPAPNRWQPFKTTQDAEQAGYRAARNCRALPGEQTHG